MTASPHLAYDDLPSIQELGSDARRVEATLGLTSPLDRAARAGAPSLHYADFPREVRKPDITVTAAAQRLANALSLHLD